MSGIVFVAKHISKVGGLSRAIMYGALLIGLVVDSKTMKRKEGTSDNRLYSEPFLTLKIHILLFN